ncbi:hypothetical protein [Williamsia sp.]|uniref:hypothetical protein n=1 Tax=Williamsia sp. TaxID=1872085 RepID=UPI001A1E409B|nr:hypothetical protein [Williamsia sp.]MBJ7290991.1 hypothetical protein [Williamsia sp.]
MPSVSTTDRWRLRLLAARGNIAVVLLVLVVLSLILMWLGYLGKLDCGGAPYFADGRSKHWPVGKNELLMPCYSDLQFLWIGRDINNHVFPYIHGGITPDGVLYGGVVEYPVLSGLLMYFGAIGAHTDTQFFQHSALILLPFGIGITVLLGLMTRWRALLWAATPPLILYSFHNWEVPVVATVVGAVAVMYFGAQESPKTGRRRIPFLSAAIIAAILLSIGFSLKLYPGLFVVPLVAYVLTRGRGARSTGDWSIEHAAGAGVSGGLRGRMLSVRRAGLDWTGAAWVTGAAIVTVLAAQLPFMILGYRGWKAALSFQGKRRSDVDTNSIWYWGVRHLTDAADISYNSVVGIASPLLILASFVLVVYLGVRVWRTGDPYPWIGVSAAMLAGFMLFHKVHSPQYTLWILPFFVLLRVAWPIIVLYLLADLSLDLTIFRLFGIYTSGSPMKWWVMGGVQFGVWTHALLLAILIFAFVRAPVRMYVRKTVGPPDKVPDTVTV